MLRRFGEPRLGWPLQPQLPTAWVQFNGLSSGPIRGSHNVSSVTRNGTGDYTVTLQQAMAATEYVLLFTAKSASTGSADLKQSTQPTTTSFNFITRVPNDTATDFDVASVSILGRA